MIALWRERRREPPWIVTRMGRNPAGGSVELDQPEVNEGWSSGIEPDP